MSPAERSGRRIRDRGGAPDHGGARDPAGPPDSGAPPDPEGEAVDRADYDPDHDPSAPIICEVCGGEMFYTAACKLKCPRCGYSRDCSDP